MTDAILSIFDSLLAELVRAHRYLNAGTTYGVDSAEIQEFRFNGEPSWRPKYHLRLNVSEVSLEALRTWVALNRIDLLPTFDLKAYNPITGYERAVQAMPPTIIMPQPLWDAVDLSDVELDDARRQQEEDRLDAVYSFENAWWPASHDRPLDGAIRFLEAFRTHLNAAATGRQVEGAEVPKNVLRKTAKVRRNWRAPSLAFLKLLKALVDHPAAAKHIAIASRAGVSVRTAERHLQQMARQQLLVREDSGSRLTEKARLKAAKTLGKNSIE